MGLLCIIYYIISNCYHGDDNPGLKKERFWDLKGFFVACVRVLPDLIEYVVD